MDNTVYRGGDYRNPQSFNLGDSRTVAIGLALLTLAMGFACVLAAMLPSV